MNQPLLQTSTYTRMIRLYNMTIGGKRDKSWARQVTILPFPIQLLLQVIYTAEQISKFDYKCNVLKFCNSQCSHAVCCYQQLQGQPHESSQTTSRISALALR